MNPSAPFIGRPVATTLLTIGVALAGFFAFLRLPVAPLPQIDYPTITVSASMPGASPATMAATVATPLERHLGIIADVTEMSSESTVGITGSPCSSASTGASTAPRAMCRRRSMQRAPTCRRVSVRTPPTIRSTRPPRRSRS